MYQGEWRTECVGVICALIFVLDSLEAGGCGVYIGVEGREKVRESVRKGWMNCNA